LSSSSRALLSILVVPFMLVVPCTLGCGGLIDDPRGSGGEGGGAASEGEGEGEGEEIPPGTPTWNADVAPLVNTHCVACHQDGGIAPFPLTAHADAAPMAEAMKDATEARVMPPWLAAPDCADYDDDPSLTDAEIALIGAWAAAGALEGSGAAPTVSQQLTTSPEPDVELSMPAPYTQALEPDEYRCFPLEWPLTQTAFVTGFRVSPGNAAVVHHIIASVVPAEKAQATRDSDDADEGPGFTCLNGGGGMTGGLGGGGGGVGGGGVGDGGGVGGGGVGGDGRAGGSGPLFVWAPGSDGASFPGGTGIRVEAGALVVLQIHYNSDAQGPQEDLTTVGFATVDSIDHEAMFLPWMNPAWLNSMNIPAGDAAVDFTFAFDPTFLTGGAPFTLYTPMLHMHNLGRRADLALVDDAGAEDCLLDIPQWDFHWQLSYPLSEPRRVEPGQQRLRIHCQFDNSGGSEDVSFGEGTSDEMCLGFLYVALDG
jgi:hypothetical protein